MKRLFLAGVALAALTSSAFAADIPRRAVVEQRVAAPVQYVAPVYNWSGFYVGFNAGWGWGNGSMSGPPRTGDFDLDGGVIGAQMGYNWQVNQIVWGLETDIAWTGIDGSTRCGGGVRCRIENTWLGTTRGRIGVAMDRWMPYVTGGLAYGDVEADATGFPGRTDTRLGWTLGGGVEVALGGPWTAKFEYLFVDLGDFNCNRACGAARGPDKVEYDAHIVRAGFNYRF
jgi:outer membrane immunogenic protein